jgi:hypothetical protein
MSFSPNTNALRFLGNGISGSFRFRQLCHKPKDIGILFYERSTSTGRVPIIITTNFDTLIEQAAAACGGRFEIILDDADLSTMPVSSILPRLVKLHGCITRPTALGVTIRAVAHERGVESRRAALKFFLGSGQIDNVIGFGDGVY